MEHLAALKRYLLLGQGDFVQYLMDQLGYKPCEYIFYVDYVSVDG